MEREVNVTLMQLLEKNLNYQTHSGKGVGTDKEWRHRYISLFYEENFKQFKDKPINLLEIGTGHGGSLILWNDYFEKGLIFGVDVNNYTDPVITTYPRITTFLTNAYTEEFADKFALPAFDIVIDDGPHTLNSFLDCIRIYFPRVKKGGVLVIEDIPQFDFAEFLKKQYPQGTIYDTREETGISDNIMFVLWK